MVDRITHRSLQISDQPFSGRKLPEYQADDVRELIENPYRIIYRVKEENYTRIATNHCMLVLGFITQLNNHPSPL